MESFTSFFGFSFFSLSALAFSSLALAAFSAFSLASCSLLFGVAVAVESAFLVESALALVLSLGTARGEGFSSVTASENSRALAVPMSQAFRRESESVTVYAAGGPILVVSLPASRLFHPSQTA